MQYFDKDGREIKAGMKLLMEDGSIELVYDTVDADGKADLGINAYNEEFLDAHLNRSRECYPLSNFNLQAVEVCPSEQEIRDELESLEPIIQITELALDYNLKMSEADYAKYEFAIARREKLTAILNEESPATEITMR